MKETPAARKRRHLMTIKRCLEDDSCPDVFHDLGAANLYKVIHASVFASVPGKQKARNAVTLLDAAVKATVALVRRQFDDR